MYTHAHAHTVTQARGLPQTHRALWGWTRTFRGHTPAYLLPLACSARSALQLHQPSCTIQAPWQLKDTLALLLSLDVSWDCILISGACTKIRKLPPSASPVLSLALSPSWFWKPAVGTWRRPGCLHHSMHAQTSFLPPRAHIPLHMVTLFSFTPLACSLYLLCSHPNT